jgi:predicted NAD/FAD-binding protein
VPSAERTQIACVWSCSAASSLSSPAYFILTFFRNHHLLQLTSRPQWLTLKYRSADYVKRVVQKWGLTVKLECAVVRVTKQPGELKDSKAGAWSVEDQNGAVERYAFVFVWCCLFLYLCVCMDKEGKARIMAEQKKADTKELI